MSLANQEAAFSRVRFWFRVVDVNMDHRLDRFQGLA